MAIKQTEKYLSSFDVVIQLMPNCPIRKLDTLNSSIINFFKTKKKSQISFLNMDLQILGGHTKLKIIKLKLL